MAVKAFERAEFVPRQAWRNTGHVHLGLTVLAARALQHAKGRIGWLCVKVGHVRPPLKQAGARQLPDTGPWRGNFHAFKNGPLVNIDQRA